ncbi:MAG: prolipoprotein diacylglyceryl transferase [Planctomycetota bacterium]|jgi:phosphatidylglycerol:prolipoprotein diacylglycerol transferase
MYPELFTIPFTHLTVKSYGLMMVIGFLLAVSVIRRLSRDITPDRQLITNAALYSLVAGIVGARLFFVVHYFESFRNDLLSVFAVWKGGLELLGGVVLAVTVIILYLLYHRLPIRRYLDILAIALLLALAFGRLGCFLNGCCFGRPTNLFWSVRFPYGSLAYRSQINPDMKRNRPEAQLNLPTGYFRFYDDNGLYLYDLEPYEQLTQEQKEKVDNGPYRCLPVHPTQLYSSANAALCSFLLYLFWRDARKNGRFFAKPGCTFGLMFVLYGATRFFIEYVRDDNPFEYAWWIIYRGGTVSQNSGIYMVILGVILIAIFAAMKPDKVVFNSSRRGKDFSN